jgi:hypothetical protein
LRESGCFGAADATGDGAGVAVGPEKTILGGSVSCGGTGSTTGWLGKRKNAAMAATTANAIVMRRVFNLIFPVFDRLEARSVENNSPQKDFRHLKFFKNRKSPSTEFL